MGPAWPGRRSQTAPRLRGAPPGTAVVVLAAPERRECRSHAWRIRCTEPCLGPARHTTGTRSDRTRCIAPRRAAPDAPGMSLRRSRGLRRPCLGFCRIDSADGPPVRCATVEARVAVLASGAGTNLQALLDDPIVGPRVALVISDRAAAGALGRAESRGVPAVHLDPSGRSSSEYDLATLEKLRDDDVDIVCLAGYMRILTPPIVRAFEGRMLNVHPSLLPAFPGAHAVRDALAWGAKVTGVTVHLVDEEVDHRLYPEAVRLVLEDRLVIEGRRVQISQAAER